MLGPTVYVRYGLTTPLAAAPGSPAYDGSDPGRHVGTLSDYERPVAVTRLAIYPVVVLARSLAAGAADLFRLVNVLSTHWHAVLVTTLVWEVYQLGLDVVVLLKGLLYL